MRYRLPAALAACLILFGCETDATQKDGTDTSKTTNSPTETKVAPKPETKGAPLPDKTPAVFRVKLEMTCGDCVVEVHRDWAPNGADRFFEMVKAGFFKDIGFFRVMKEFMVQFGIHGDPDVADEWSGKLIGDDQVTQPNTRGMLSFATRGPNTRTTQIFINYADNRRLDRQGFSPFAKIVEGMENVDKIYEVRQKPAQSQITARGNAYLKESFPQIDYIKRAVYLGEPKK